MTNQDEIQVSEILKKVPNRFMLSIAVARRARQLNEGAKPLIYIPEDEPVHPILTALEEILQDKLEVVLELEKDEDLEMIEEVDRYFEEVKAKAEENEEMLKKSKKEKDKDKDTKKSKSKSLVA